MTTVSPRRNVGQSVASTNDSKAVASVAPSKARAAVGPSLGMAQINVVTFHAARGTASHTRWPGGARPRRRAMLVVVPVSST